MALIPYTPALISTTENLVMKSVVTPEHWNELFNLLSTQGNNNTNAIQAMLLAFAEDATAEELGVAPIAGVSGTTVQTVMAGLKALVDLCYTATATDALLAQRESVTAANALVKTITFNPTDGKFTITTQGGAVTVIDTALEKVATNFVYNPNTQALDLTYMDGTTVSVSLSAFITETEYTDSAQIDFTVSNHTVTATIKAGSITAAMLESTLLATVEGYKNAAATSATNAAVSESNALTYKNNAASSATAAATSATNAGNSATSASSSATAANSSKNAAATSATNASTSETNANTSKNAAATSATNAGNSATAAAGSATTAGNSATAAASSATNAGNSATAAAGSAITAGNNAILSESYAKGGTSTRAGEDTDNAKYWSEQAAVLAGGSLIAVGNGYALNNGSTRPALGLHAVDTSYTLDNTCGASGECSHAEGGDTTASGECSHAEGASTTASGEGSHAEGVYTTASGDASHAEGEEITASGEGSHAEGVYTTASGRFSHAEGNGTTASGDSSHAEGLTTLACHGTLYKITAFDDTAKTITLDNVSGLAVNDLLQIKVVSNKSYADLKITAINEFVVTLDTTETISAFWVYAIKRATAQHPTHAEGEDTTASGITSHAEGYRTTASKNGTHAEGYRTTASGIASHAEGTETTASGNASHTEGNSTTASENASHAEGYRTTASGHYSHAEGEETAASGYVSHAEGQSTTASGNISHAAGSFTTASGNYSHTEGQSTIASGEKSHAEGYSTTASGDGSHAEGDTTTASGNYSHTEGNSTTASGYVSHAEGYKTTASGADSHAEGDFTTASGVDAHAAGLFTIAQGCAQTVIGVANIAQGDSEASVPATTDLLFVVGNGTVDEELWEVTGRSNALTLDYTGNLWTAGSQTATQFKLSALNTAPASATDTGVAGEIRVTADYIYVCVATNTWKRTALTTW